MADTKKTVFITGSTHGLAFVEHYISTGWNVIGTARAYSNAEKLEALSPFKIITLGVSDEQSVVEAARQLEGVLIDLVINNAGVGIYMTFATVTKQSLMSTFEVNAVGPFFVTRAMLPNLQLAVKDRGTAFVLQVSSPLGSLTSNTTANAQTFRGQYGYCASKVALNMVTRLLAVGLLEHNVTVVAVNPGYVNTDLTSEYGILKPPDAVVSMDKIVSTLSLEDTGKFFDTDPQNPSSELPW
ncbi:hypothetical protein BBJ29_009137 [Phytophthora kernoviae]|uniref:Uncharacterized protein n=1 Tax=Phytophthora kernoviae TaxID=325452 RepID=A0A3F2REH5_9STRA|nr:hypothetical protein BBJ29_009137 [Phytophthora kernoviae]RLN54583.1 hypothetical protein BBP00_00008879 [Phytophthora kernoviae]